MTEQIPLYIGIPLAGLCIAVIVVVVALAIVLIRERKP